MWVLLNNHHFVGKVKNVLKKSPICQLFMQTSSSGPCTSYVQSTVLLKWQVLLLPRQVIRAAIPMLPAAEEAETAAARTREMCKHTHSSVLMALLQLHSEAASTARNLETSPSCSNPLPPPVRWRWAFLLWGWKMIHPPAQECSPGGIICSPLPNSSSGAGFLCGRNVVWKSPPSKSLSRVLVSSRPPCLGEKNVLKPKVDAADLPQGPELTSCSGCECPAPSSSRGW